MAKTDDWMPLFWSDWYRATLGLSPGELGCLMNLLVTFHNCGPIPAKKDILQRVAGCCRRGEWVRFGKDVLDKFFQIQDGHYALRPDFFQDYQRVTTYELRNLRPPADVWRALKQQVFTRDNFTCSYCGARGGNLQCDHIVAVSRGGTNCLENLTTACADCNRSKGAKDVQEWLATQGPRLVAINGELTVGAANGAT